MRYKRPIIAIVYDFDGTLVPGAMQDYTILPALGIKPQDFWRKVEKENLKTKGESTLTYLRLLVEACRERNYRFTASELRRLAGKVPFYTGAVNYFDRINAFVKRRFKDKFVVRHYIISSGLREIIEATPIAKKVHRIFACEYYFDASKRAVFPKVIVNDTLKTQFLFRISKGAEDLHESVNRRISRKNLAIPFRNILYIGDGMTDVPSMAVTKKFGGHCLAVYKPGAGDGFRVCKNLLKEGRVDVIAEADYRSGHKLEKLIRSILRKIAGRLVGRDIASERNACSERN